MKYMVKCNKVENGGVKMEYRDKKKDYYNIFMSILALLVVSMLIVELTVELSSTTTKIFYIVDNSIWVIFCFDYFGRLIKSKSKKKFIKENVIDLISILPLDSAFKTLRIFRVTRLMKLTKVTKLLKVAILLTKGKNKLDKFLKTNNLNYVIYTTIMTIVFGAIGISIVEDMSFSNAIWWSFVTTTTVGYGDISPSTALGRMIAVVLMLVGIGFIGMLTGTITTFFVKNKQEKSTYRQDVIEDIKHKLDDFDSITKDELKDICIVLQSLKE